ncbi:glycosyltransferase [Subtercola boreus]|uniref:Uncharacterized protein n=1 Tax=Subtercola boreus TaxID=120213 RepID=A0A3E0WCI8_9MICO|nr:glycosyltransferase [Subtercola boreus]RFA22530.1 hypothetical protein B7R24_02585 [Subtercola boreus]RFA22886.1 hypothetical protein B7R23_02580 [Subtercola boreus]RFA28638.1 hypothetical protein B7R25_02595 [Subtercola boreus]
MKKHVPRSGQTDPHSIDYLVGGFRISVGPTSNTPGPRTHIVNFVKALESRRFAVRTVLASDMPFMARFSTIRQSDYTAASDAKVRLADAVRVGAAVWTGLNVFLETIRSPAPFMIYERIAVLQSMTSFHARKGRAIRVVEANGVLSRETAHDRHVLKAERLAAFLERRVLRRAAVVVAVSEPLKRELVEFAAIPEAKVLVLPNGVSSALTVIPLARPAGSIIIGFVGSIVKWQHLDQLLLTFASILPALEEAHGIPVMLEIIGDGAEYSFLEKLIRTNQLGDSAVLLGRLSHKEVLERMSSWTLGFAGHEKSSSRAMYHSPLKVYEYAALGLGIVCTYSDDAASLTAVGVPVHFYEDQRSLADSLEQAVADAVGEGLEDINQRRSLVGKTHSWESRADQLLSFTAQIQKTQVKRERAV